MGKWAMVRLGDVCDIRDGTHDSPQYRGQGYPLVTSKNVTHGSLDFSDVSYISAEAYEAIDKRSHVDDGDIIMPMIGTIGKPVIVIKTIDFAIKNLALIKFHKSNANNRFVYYALNGPDFLSYVNSENRGGTQKFLSLKNIRSFPLSLPPPLIQQKIADVLDRASVLIEKRKAQIEKLDLLVKSRFIEMFGDPVTNPMGWEVRPLSDIASSRLGKMLDAKQQTGEFSFPYLANYNVQWFIFDLSKLNEMDFSEADRVEFELKKGDLLVCEGGEVGRCAIWREDIQPCYFQKALHRVRCYNEVILPEYLARWFYSRAQHNGFKDIIGQATIAHLPGVKLKQLKIPVPPLALQHAFATFVTRVESQKTLLQQSLAKLEQGYKSLMLKCFSGELF